MNNTTVTVIVIGVVLVGAYYIYSKSQLQTNTTSLNLGGLSTSIPTTTLAMGLGNVFGTLYSDISGNGSTS